MPANIVYISNMNGAVGNLFDALYQYKTQIFDAIMMTSILMIPLMIRSYVDNKGRKGFWALTFVSMLFFAYGFILIIRGTPALVGFPLGFSYGFGSTFLKINDVLSSNNHIEVKPFNMKHHPKKIIVVIGESVEYNEFTKLYNTMPNAYNFGLTYSGANCSTASNYILRKGTWYPSDNNSLKVWEVESLFSLAKHQNFKTVFIDNQNVLHDIILRNYFTDSELHDIDKIYEAEDTYASRDMNSLSIVKKELMNNKVFIFINKVGAHFPYESTISKDLVSTDNMKNYRTSIKQNVILYLQKLLTMIDNDTVVLYTSDHGQNFSANATHCNPGNLASQSEYAVPFIMLSKNEIMSKLLMQSVKKYKNNLSHIEFSESVRNLLGYKVENIDSIYKQTAKNINLGFCGLYGQPIPFLGVNPSCKKLK